MAVVHRGKVVDNLGTPLEGAHIISLNTSPRKFTITDQNGNFGIQGEIGESFEITFVGMKTIRFTIYQNTPFKTYQMADSAFELNEVTVTPNKPLKTNNSNPDWLRNLLTGVTNVFDVASNTANTPPFNVNNTPTVTGQQGVVYVPEVTPKKGLNNWISDNPLAAGGIVLALIAGGTYLATKKKKTSSNGKK